MVVCSDALSAVVKVVVKVGYWVESMDASWVVVMAAYSAGCWVGLMVVP